MKQWINRCYFIVLPVLITGVFVAFDLIYYVINDDISLMQIAESFRTNTHSEHLVFINVLVGYLLKGLYRLQPNFNWYSFYELVCLNCGFIPLYYINKRFQGKALGAALISCYMLYFLTNFTFTSVAFLCCFSGMIWFYVFVRQVNKKMPVHLLFSLFLLSLGFSLRGGETFYVVTLIFIPLFIFAVIKKEKTVAVAVLALLIIILPSYSLKAADAYYKATIPESLYYNQFQEYRPDVIDGGLLDYEAHQEAFDEAGITQNDIDLISMWTFTDKNVFTAERFKVISKTRSFSERYNLDIGNNLLLMLSSSEYMIFAVLALILFITVKKRRRDIASVFLVNTAFTAYLNAHQRSLLRVSNAISLCTGMVLLMLLLLNRKEKNRNEKPSRSWLINTTAVAVVGVMLVTLSAVSEMGSIPKYEGNLALDNYVHTVTEDSTLISDFSCTYYTSLREYRKDFLKPKYNLQSKLVTLGGWNVYSYYWYDSLERKGLAEYGDSFMQVILKDDAYFMMRVMKPQYIVKYFDEHYHITVHYKVIRRFDDINVTVFKFYKAD